MSRKQKRGMSFLGLIRFTALLLTQINFLSAEVDVLPDEQDRPGDSALFKALPEVNVSADLSFFFLQNNNAYYKRHYFIESDIYLEPMWVSFKNRLYFSTAFSVIPGLGDDPEESIVFDPVDINFAIIPILEYRHSRLMFQAGIEHRCFHEIDRKEFRTVYWNKLFFNSGSDNFHEKRFYRRVIEEKEWSFLRRFSWHAQWGVFLRGIFGLVNPSYVNYENNNVHEGQFQARYAFFRWKRVVLAVSSQSSIGLWKGDNGEGEEKKIYVRQMFSADNCFTRGDFGVVLFVNYILDDVPLYSGKPRFSKNGLLDIGVRVFR